MLSSMLYSQTNRNKLHSQPMQQEVMLLQGNIFSSNVKFRQVLPNQQCHNTSFIMEVLPPNHYKALQVGSMSFLTFSTKIVDRTYVLLQIVLEMDMNSSWLSVLKVSEDCIQHSLYQLL